MRDALEIAVPGTFALLFFGLIFGFLAWLRWMRFRETLALADRGFAPADAPNGTNRMLRWALILMALGLALSCGILPLAFDSIHAFPALIPGLSMLFLGLAFLLYWLVTGGRDQLAARGGALPTLRPRPAPAPSPSAYAADDWAAAGADAGAAEIAGHDDDAGPDADDAAR